MSDVIPIEQKRRERDGKRLSDVVCAYLQEKHGGEAVPTRPSHDQDRTLRRIVISAGEAVRRAEADWLRPQWLTVLLTLEPGGHLRVSTHDWDGAKVRMVGPA